MDIRLTLDKLKWAILKRSAKNKKGMTYEDWAAKGYEKNPEISFVIQSHNKSIQVCHIVKKLRQWSGLKEIIVIDDGSSLNHTSRLSKFLTGANEFLIKANDLFEIITYDKCIRFANGKYIVLLQDDDDFENLNWVTEGRALMKEHTKMIILGGWWCQNVELDNGFKQVPLECKGFKFVQSANRAPMWLNKELFVKHLGHINQDFAPLLFDDDEICLRTWTLGYMVGWYDAKFFSLSAGGTRVGKNALMERQTEYNGNQIVRLYRDKMDLIRDNVKLANETLNRMK